MKVTNSKVTSHRVGGGTTNIGEDDGWDAKWADGSARISSGSGD